ncbi:Replication factor A [Trypanosoma melophagium]|uniref:Replication factor A n=1 Tax=Trypanosoma melophagium TaxID=715481 RepID=UPI00351A231A|nr:Replication factor A [Trypanosoma melophagium]
MDSLTQGFCASALMGSIPNGGGDSWSSLWPSPTLQVVDIQRYPRVITQPSIISRFYLAVSDSASLIWLIVPPGSEMEELIHTFQIEVGCCITLKAYTVVAAKNGLNVIVPISIRYSDTVLSLLGNPLFDSSLFELSIAALTKKRGFIRMDPLQTTKQSTVLSLREIVEVRGEGLRDYAVILRILWKGKNRCLASGNLVDRFIFNSVGVDKNGDSILMSFIGSSAFYDTLPLGTCIRAVGGTLFSRNNEEKMLQLQFDERFSSVVNDLEMEEIVPKYPFQMFGTKIVQDVVKNGNVGNVVSVEGIVVTVSPGTLVHTKRGQVERSGILLRDSSSPSSSSCVIEITLWEDISRNVKPAVGERWCFCEFVVSGFMRRISLSSRSISSAFKMQKEMRPKGLEMYQEVNEQEEVSEASTHITERDSVQVVLGLEEASETLPVLAKIQRVILPITYSACRVCTRQVSSGDVRCTVCGGTERVERYLVRLELSDGIRVVYAVGFAQIGETLFGMDANTMLIRQQESPTYAHTIVRELVGVPLLFWLLHSADGLLHVVKCKYISMAHCTAIVLGAISQLMSFNEVVT